MNADKSQSVLIRKKKAAILSGYYQANLANTPANAATRPEQTSQVSGEDTVLRRTGCFVCTTANSTNPYPLNERNPGAQ
jgi:hypothetical protein